MSKDKESIISLGHIELRTGGDMAPVNTGDLPILPTRNLVLFPGEATPLTLTRESSEALARKAEETRLPIGIFCQHDADDDNPTVSKGLVRTGVIADIIKVISIPDGPTTALVQARDRAQITGAGAGSTFPGHLSAKVKLLTDVPYPDYEKFKAIMDQIDPMAENIMSAQFSGLPAMTNFREQFPDMAARLNHLATILPIDAKEKVKMLRTSELEKRAMLLLESLNRLSAKEQIADEIRQQTQANLTARQREAFLNTQLDIIRQELTEINGVPSDNPDIERLLKKAKKVKMPKEAMEAFTRHIDKLSHLNPTTPDYSTELDWLEVITDLPWDKKASAGTPDIKKARRILEDSHFGLDKVKQRILEQIAVIMAHPRTSKSPILCLVGPPGVGKTSLGRAVAEALCRPYQRVALGGVHDESEIRGHRRTYVGAMPGRIIKAMKEAKAANPVLLLDEVDKISSDRRGDPASALLEVLDPEQNTTFHDNFVDLPYDLSKALFIATANTTSTIDSALLDRMELIELSGYLTEEKQEIARRHLLPKVTKENGLTPDKALKISDEALEALIENYTAESGVRNLEKLLSSLTRKMILATLSGDDFPQEVTPNDLKPLLGLPRHIKDKYEPGYPPGVVTGLAWTSVGGEILLAEASLSPGKGEKISITGNLGDVMKESAAIALQWVKANAQTLGIDPETFEKNNMHVHFPEGAIPKDGPSAGITIATAIASALLQKPVKDRIAMTGEITLRGSVLPVGGIKEKILAAKRAGINTIVLSAKNQPDVEDIPELYRNGLSFKYVDTVAEVLSEAL